jgi:glycosyltransferase involved in cell wall biosynthesis
MSLVSGRSGVEPFFRTAPPDEARPRRLLLISYYFAPINVVGALRWQRLSAYAAARGWAIDVILVNPGNTPFAEDRGRLAELPSGTSLYTVPDTELPILRLQRWVWRRVRPLVRRNGASPTVAAEESSEPPSLPHSRQLGPAYLARLHYAQLDRWAHSAADAGVAIARDNRPDYIVSSGPPQSTHEAARLLSHRLGVPWLMDMRDPWCAVEVMPHEYASQTWYKLAARHEARCIRAARLVSTTTEALRRDLVSRYPEASSRVITIMNGADPQTIPNVPRTRTFTLAYAGNLYVGRDPRNLFRAVAKVTRELNLTPNDLTVEFMGGVDFARRPIGDIAADIGVGPFVKSTPARPHKEALRFLAGATMLVSLPQYAHLAIPAKLFEYVQFDAWLLVLAEPESATALLFGGTAADVVNPDDVDGIAAAIRRRFEQHRRGEQPVAVNHDGRFDRARQASCLFDALEGSLSGR